MERLLEDVNLCDIAFVVESSKVILGFLNMSDGEKVGSFICTGVVLFDYRTLPDSALPHYVGEVDHTLISRDDVPDLLDRLRYGFVMSRERTSAPFMIEVHHIHIDGGVWIDIVCGDMQFVP